MEISDLPPRYQKQAQKKLEQQKGKRPSGAAENKSKYKNEKTTVNGIQFDSRKEAERYQQLMLLLKAGKITQLKLQHSFTLQGSFTTPDGEKIRAITYIADFTYFDEKGNFTIEDVKGYKTRTYKDKYKLMANLGYTITEI